MSAFPAWQRSPYLSPLQPGHRVNLLGPLRLVTAPTGQVVTTERAKAQARVEIAEEDDLIDDMIDAATVFCQQEIVGERQFLTATYDVPVQDWWWHLPLKVPRPPLQSVTSITYYDSAGVLQTLASTFYLVETSWRQPGTIDRAPAQYWPLLQRDRRHPITVRFVCGYGAPADVPATLKQAILLLVGHWFNNREAFDSLAISAEIGVGLERLLLSENYGSYA